MTDLDPALRRVTADVPADQLTDFLGFLVPYATDNNIRLDVGYTDSARTKPSGIIRPEVSDFSTLFPENPKLGRHVAGTVPTTLEGYGGKEHFWAWGLNADEPLPKRQASRLFTELAFPSEGSPTGSGGRLAVKKVSRDEVDIKVAFRADINLRQPPAEIAPPHSTNVGVALHINSEDADLIKSAFRDMVVQMRGVVALGNNPVMANRILSPYSQDALAAIMPQLSLLPDAEKPHRAIGRRINWLGRLR